LEGEGSELYLVTTGLPNEPDVIKVRPISFYVICFLSKLCLKLENLLNFKILTALAELLLHIIMWIIFWIFIKKESKQNLTDHLLVESTKNSF